MSSAKDPADWIADGARRGPHRPFLRTPAGRELSYAGLQEQIARFATALTARGVEQGDRVAAQVDKSVDAVLLYLACLDVGAVFVPINVANTENEVDYFLRDSRPRLAVVKPSSRALLEPVAMRAQISHVETLGADGEGSLPELVIRCAAGARPPRHCGRDSLAAIVYTSGTTGRAKGAMLTRGNLACNAEVLADVCARLVRRNQYRARLEIESPVAAEIRCSLGARAFARGHRLYGCANALYPAAAGARPRSRGGRRHAIVHLRFRAAPGRNASRFQRADGTPHHRTIWNDRDIDELVEPLRRCESAGIRGTGVAGRRHTGLQCRRRHRQSRNQRAQRVCGLLGRRRQDPRRIHG